MKNLKNRVKITFTILLIAFSVSFDGLAQSNGSASSENGYLGQIPVYKFRMDTLTYGAQKKYSAVGTEYMAGLYSSRVGNDTYFRITINGETYAVTSNPYNGKVTSEQYYAHWLLKEGSYQKISSIHYKAGPYFLDLPYGKPTIQASTSSSDKPSSNNSSSTNTTSLSWQLVGKVQAVYNIRIERSGREDDAIYESETGFLYSAFDGKEMKYKLSIPGNGGEYNVYRSSSYDGSRVHWDRKGRYVSSVPSLSSMYTHIAGRYHFNMENVKQ